MDKGEMRGAPCPGPTRGKQITWLSEVTACRNCSTMRERERERERQWCQVSSVPVLVVVSCGRGRPGSDWRVSDQKHFVPAFQRQLTHCCQATHKHTHTMSSEHYWKPREPHWPTEHYLQTTCHQIWPLRTYVGVKCHITAEIVV